MQSEQASLVGNQRELLLSLGELSRGNSSAGPPPASLPDAVEGVSDLDDIIDEIELFESQEDIRRFSEWLSKTSGELGDFHGDIIAVGESFAKLEAVYSALRQRVAELSASCLSLSRTCDQMAVFATGIDEILQNFSNYDSVHSLLYSPRVDVTSKAFADALQCIDSSITFLEVNSHFLDAHGYLSRFQNLQARSLALVRSHLSSAFKQAATSISQAVSDAPEATVASATGADSVYFLKLRAVAGPLRSVIAMIEPRTHRREYAQVLLDCMEVYVARRTALLSAAVRSRLASLSATGDLDHVVRGSIEYLLRLSSRELQLWLHFFAERGRPLMVMLENLWGELYEQIRPRIIRCHDVAQLCAVVDILNESNDSSSGVRLPPEYERADASPPRPSALTRVLTDAQERLVYAATQAAHEELSGFVPSIRDLDYPGVLLERNEEQRSEVKEIVEKEEVEHDAEVATESENEKGGQEWYPTIKITLLWLSRLYGRISTGTFESLALEIVSLGIASILSAAKQLAKKKGSEHGDLFTIRHFLILRTQLAPFETDFVSTERSLQFQFRDALFHLFSPSHWLRFSSTNSLILFALDGIPTITETYKDARVDLERELRRACDSIILTESNTILGGLPAFLKSASLFLGAGSPGALLKEQSFATEAIVSELAVSLPSVRDRWTSSLRTVQLYAPPPVSPSLLVEPIRFAVLQSLRQFSAIARDYFGLDVDDAAFTGYLPDVALEDADGEDAGGESEARHPEAEADGAETGKVA